jgi:hypothetical protein
MEWFKIIAPLTDVALGFFLSECGKFWAEKKTKK